MRQLRIVLSSAVFAALAFGAEYAAPRVQAQQAQQSGAAVSGGAAHRVRREDHGGELGG